MQCTHPHLIYDKTNHCYMEVPCRCCMACRLNYTKEWAIRCMNEASCHKHNCFLTLTYDDEHLPKDKNLVKSDLQKFFKRLRKLGVKCKYLACGEYGGQFGRPHYHSVIFGWYPSDAYLWRNKRVNPTFRSPTLEKLWTSGISEFGDVTFNSARYVASYIVKQHRGNDKKWYEENNVVPEFVVMSQGLGKDFCNKYKEQLKVLGYLKFQGRKCKLPRYYEQQLFTTDEEKEERKNAKRKACDEARQEFERNQSITEYNQFSDWFLKKFGRCPKFKDWLGRKIVDARSEREVQLQRLVNQKRKDKKNV